MLRARLFPTLPAVCLGVFAVAGPALAQNGSVPQTVFEMPLPGGLRGALAALNDRATPDRSQFLLEVIRRSYAPGSTKANPQDAVLRALLDHMNPAGRTRTSPFAVVKSGQTATPETLPLPLSPAIWTDVVFGGRVTPANLAAEIVQSRSASRVYYGLLSLDDSTRHWLATETDLITQLSTVHSATFALVAPAFRVADGAVRTPGGERADPVWQALVGRRANEPAAFLRALLTSDDGRLAYFFSAFAQLTPARLRLALNLDAPDPARVDAARRLYSTFTRVAIGWKLDERPFWRPSLDPALMVAGLRLDAEGRPVLPGTRPFWTAVFADDDPSPPRQGQKDDGHGIAEGEPATVAWLSEQVFKGGPVVHRRPYQQVLFASRILDRVTPETARDSVDAVRAAGTYPALVAALERAGLREVAAFASAGRKAAQIATIDDHTKVVRALGQFQGMLALITRAAVRGSVSAASLSPLVTSLSAVELGERGEYEGRLVGWLAAAIAAHAASGTSRIPGAAAARTDGPSDKVAVSLDISVLELLAGPMVAPASFVDWEGTRYRLDFRAAETARLARLLGDSPRPYVSSAQTLVTVADALSEEGRGADRLRHQITILEQIAQAAVWERESASVIQRVTRDLASGGAPPRSSAIAAIARTLRVLADDLLARGLMELAYAVALGHADPLLISAGDAASRHDFGLRLAGASRSSPWELPHTGAERTQDWRAIGSLLGLDVRFSEFLLLRLTSRPPPTRPSLNESDRRVLIEAVALADATALSDADRDVIVTTIRKGRSRLTAVRTPADALTLADEIPLGPMQRTLLAWTVTYDPQRVGTLLSPTELFWLGQEHAPLPATLHAFGVAAERRLGCLCIRFPDRQPWEMLAGRWDSGMLATGFADLNLRLAELLAELKMPAALLAPVLASATLDLVTNVTSREPDDHRALVEFVQGLGVERVEHYLALLTTDGPLVPVAESSDREVFNRSSALTSGVPR